MYARQSPRRQRHYDEQPATPYTPYTPSTRTPRSIRHQMPNSAFGSPPPMYQSPISNRFAYRSPTSNRFAYEQDQRHGLQHNLQRMSRFFRVQQPPQLAYSPLPPPRYALVIVDRVISTPLSVATQRATFYKGFSVLSCVLAGIAALYGFLLNELVVLNIPAYTQNGSNHAAQIIYVRAYGEINALAGSTWSDWSSNGLFNVLVAQGSIIAGVTCLVVALMQSYGVFIRSEMPVALQALMAGIADRKFPDERFSRYGFLNVKVWWMAVFACVPLIIGTFHIVVFLSTQSAMRGVAALGERTDVALGLTLYCSIVSIVSIVTGSILGALEQQRKAQLKDIEDHIGIERATEVVDPAYAQSMYDGYDQAMSVDEPRINSRHATRADSLLRSGARYPATEWVGEWDELSDDEYEAKPVFKRKTSSRKQKVREWDDISYDKRSGGTPSKSSAKEFDWGKPLQT